MSDKSRRMQEIANIRWDKERAKKQLATEQ
jgi:hypothetical protein